MAASKELEDKAKRLCETWASIVDAQLQDFLTKGSVNDKLGAALAAFRLSQAAKMLSDYFKEIGGDIISSETELRACREAVEQMYELVRKRVDLALGSPTFAPVAELGGSPDRSQN